MFFYCKYNNEVPKLYTLTENYNKLMVAYNKLTDSYNSMIDEQFESRVKKIDVSKEKSSEDEDTSEGDTSCEKSKDKNKLLGKNVKLEFWISL